MNSFGDLLRIFIEKSGYTNYKIAQKASVNRTTLQKILSGERKPSDVTYNKILPFLKLTPLEKAQLSEAFEISQIGNDIFERRTYVRKLLEKIPDISFSPSMEQHSGDTDTTLPSSIHDTLPYFTVLLPSITCSHSWFRKKAQKLLPASGLMHLPTVLFSVALSLTIWICYAAIAHPSGILPVFSVQKIRQVHLFLTCRYWKISFLFCLLQN